MGAVPTWMTRSFFICVSLDDFVLCGNILPRRGGVNCNNPGLYETNQRGETEEAIRPSGEETGEGNACATGDAVMEHFRGKMRQDSRATPVVLPLPAVQLPAGTPPVR